jgi:hypothetical protein
LIRRALRNLAAEECNKNWRLFRSASHTLRRIKMNSEGISESEAKVCRLSTSVVSHDLNQFICQADKFHPASSKEVHKTW